MDEKANPQGSKEQRIAELVRQIGAAERELGELAPGRSRSAAAELQPGILDAIPAHVAVLDPEGVIVVVNEAWRRFATANVLQSSDFYVGQNYIGVCESAHGECAEESLAVAAGIRQVLNGDVKEFSIEYPCHSPTEKRWFRLMVTPLRDAPELGVVVMHVNITERKAAEEILSQKEREQRQLAEKLTVETRRLHESQAVANVGSWETNLATLEVTWTDETYRIFEITPDEFDGTHQAFLERVHPEDRQNVEDAFNGSLGQSRPSAIEHRLLFPDGRIKFVEERWQAFSDANGKLERAVGTCQDITQRKLTELAVTISEDSLARAQRIAQMGNWDWNIVTDELYWSAQIFELFGVDPSKAIGTYEQFLDGVHPEDRERTHQAVMDAVEGRAPYNVEHRVLWPDGTVRVMQEHGEVLRDEAGRALKMTGTVQDITERKQTQDALDESQRQYRDFVETSSNVIWTVDTEGRFTFINQASRTIFGRDPEEVIGRLFHEFIPEDQRAANDEVLARMLRDGKDTIEYTNRIRRKDGSIAILSSNARVVQDSQGEVVGISGMSRDITEVAKAQEAILRSEERFRTLFDQAAVGMCIASAEGVFLRTNERFCEIVGYSEDELLQRDCIESTHPSDRAREAEIVAQMLAGEIQSQAWEKRYLHKDGHPIWCNLTLALLPEINGESRQFVGVIEDIHERRAAVEQLKHREQLFRIASRIARMGGWSVDLPEVRITWSDEVCAIHDVPAGTVPSLDQALGFYTEESYPVIESAFSLCTREGTPFDLELEVSTAKGRRIWVRAIGEAERDAAGMVNRVQGAFQDITEQKLAQEKLRQSESLRRIAGAVAKIGGWSLSVPDNRLEWSEEIFDMVEYPRDRIPNLDDALDLYPEPWHSQLSDALSECATEGKPFEQELMIRSATGRLFWARCKAEPEFDETGNVVQVRGAFQDISEQKSAEEAIRDLGGRLVTTLEAITDAFFTIDREWRFTYLNTEAEKVLERNRASLLGQFIWDEFPEAVGSTFQQQYQLAIAEMQSVSFEEYFAPLSKWFEVRAYPSTEGLAVYFRDVTELRNSREALAASEKEFRNLAEAMPQIVWITRPDGWNLYFNQHWVDYTGLTMEESMGDGWNKPFHPEDQQRAWDAWQLATSTLGIYSLECRLRRWDGEYRWWLIRGEPQMDDSGKVLKWFGTCTDIHALKLAELEVTRTNRALKMLSACNEALIHAEAEETLLQQICQTAIVVGGYHMAWVGYAQEDESRSIVPLAWAGVEEGYLSEINVTWLEDDPSGQGPVGRTIRENQIVVIEDIEADPAFSTWIGAARQRGYKGMICLPLNSGGRTFGVLALYSSQLARTPTEELSLLRELADDLSFGIQTLRSSVERNKLQQAVVAIASGVSSEVGDVFFTSLVRHTIEALDADAGFMAVLDTPEAPTARTITAILPEGETANFDYRLEGTPCEQVVLGQTCLVEQGVQERYPRDNMLAEHGIKAYAGTPLFDSRGTVIGLIAVLFQKPIVDEHFIPSTLQIFAARAASELERQKSDQQMREQAALLDAAHDAILVKDLEDRIVYWNKGAERLYGWAASEVIGRKSGSFLHKDLVEIEDAHQKALQNGSWEGELRNLDKEGNSILVQASWTLVRDSDGRPTSMLAINSDLTEKKKLEQQFLRAQRMESIGTLAGGIAHDLNNVLAPIMMSVELLKDLADKEEDKDLLETLMNSAQRGSDLVNQVLTFARGVEGQRIPVDVRHLVDDLGKVMRDTFPKNIVVECECASPIWAVPGDPTQIHQVILNLCVNARDAMPNGGKLSLTVENTVLDETYAAVNSDVNVGPYVIVEVEDSGTGIPHEARERIFEPFFTTKEVGKGTGLGLSTTMAIVKSHGGFINLYSELGKGSRFKAYFPADDSNIASGERLIELDRLPRGSGELILVVDDEASVRHAARSTLERFGYSVMLAEHGAEAVSIYAQYQNAISVVLTDMAMPIMDGPALIIALKALNPKVRVIASSGLAAQGENAKAVGLDVEYFIPKPYMAEALLKSLRTILDSEG